MKTRVLVIATWIAALTAWTVYERTLRDAPPPPPPPPPAPAPCPAAQHGGVTEIVEQQFAGGRRLLWAHGFRSTVYSDRFGPDVCAVATEDPTTTYHHLNVYRIGEPCPACGAPSWRRISAESYDENDIDGSPRFEDINKDGKTDMLISCLIGGWEVHTIVGDTLVLMSPAIDGLNTVLPQDLDGDGVSELIYFHSRRAINARFLVWDAGRYTEEGALPLYEREMAQILEHGFTSEDDVSDFIFYATLLGRAADAWEVARPQIIAAELDEHALRDQLEVEFADLTLYRP